MAAERAFHRMTSITGSWKLEVGGWNLHHFFPASNFQFPASSVSLTKFGIEWKVIRKHGHLASDRLDSSRVGAMGEHLIDQLGDVRHFRLLHAARGQRRRPQPDAAGSAWRPRGKRGRV